jgi:hypothetical protein
MSSGKPRRGGAILRACTAPPGLGNWRVSVPTASAVGYGVASLRACGPNQREANAEGNSSRHAKNLRMSSAGKGGSQSGRQSQTPEDASEVERSGTGGGKINLICHSEARPSPRNLSWFY